MEQQKQGGGLLSSIFLPAIWAKIEPSLEKLNQSREREKHLDHFNDIFISICDIKRWKWRFVRFFYKRKIDRLAKP